MLWGRFADKSCNEISIGEELCHADKWSCEVNAYGITMYV